MISVFSTKAMYSAAPTPNVRLCHVRIDVSNVNGGYRVRWNRSTHGFLAMHEKLYTAREQLVSLIGLEQFSRIWWKVTALADEFENPSLRVRFFDLTTKAIEQGKLMRRNFGYALEWKDFPFGACVVSGPSN